MKSRILIVEDNPFIAMSLSELLEEHKFEVIGTEDNAEDAWEICKDTVPDLILLDVRLIDEKRGTWVAKRIKEHKLPVKIIYLTAFDDNETINLIMETEPEFYITKPFNNKVLISNIKLILNNRTNGILEVVDNRKKIRISTKDIYYIKSDGNYLHIFLVNQPPVIIRDQLNTFEKQIINYSFLRVHQRFLVNTNWVTKVSKDYIYINHQEIRISNPHRQKVIDKYKL